MPDAPARRSLQSRTGTAVTVARLLAIYVGYSLLKRVVPMQTLARRAWRAPRTARHTSPASAIAAIVRLARLVGRGRGDCVELALVCYRELSRAGFEPVLMVGLDKSHTARAVGHAWVELDGRPVVESAASLKEFVPTVGFGANGRAVAIGGG